ncbi:MAG: hypothetical protein P8Y21_13115 [Gemmatimonadales bacterium]|jgi:hypothetical protein
MSICSKTAPSRRARRNERPPSRHGFGAHAALLLLLALPAPLLSQTTDLGEVLSGYTAAEAARLEGFITEPRWDGFPTELLLEHTAEGVAKGVGADRLLAALEEYAERIDQAHKILGKRATPTSLEATADVLGRGVPEDVVRTVAAVNRRDDHLTASMVALGDLVAAGVPPDQAENLLLDAATRRQDNDDVLGLPAQVRRWIRQGYEPTDAAAEVKRTMDFPAPPDGMMDRYNRPRQDPPF